MFGWIENGGGVDKLFNRTNLTDVIFHTEGLGNNLILGNGQGSGVQAAIYVSSNCVGIGKLPNTEFSLDVSGTMCVQNEILFMNNADPYGKIVLNNTGVKMMRHNVDRVYFDTFGLFKNDVLVSDYVKTRKIVVDNFKFFSISKVSYTNAQGNTKEGYRAEVDVSCIEYLEEDDVLCINNRLYTIMNVILIDTNPNLILEFDDFNNDYKLLPFELAANIEYRTEVLMDVAKTFNNTKYIYIPVYVLGYSLDDEYTLSIDIQILNVTNKPFLIADNYYHLKEEKTKSALRAAIKTIVKLTSYIFYDDTHATLYFSSIDATTPVMDFFGDLLDKYSTGSEIPMYLFKLDTIAPKEVVETNVTWGYLVEPDNMKRVSIKNSELVDYVNPKPFQVKVTDTVKFENSLYSLSYPVTASYTRNNTVILELAGINNIPNMTLEAKRGKLTYRYLASPIPIISATLIDPYTVEYKVRNVYNFLTDLYRFVNSYAYVIDVERGMWIVKKLIVTTNESYIQLQKISPSPIQGDYIYDERSIYILPFKLQAITLLGNEMNNCYVANSLGVGTTLVNERLTVAGNIALNNQIRFYDDEKKNFCYQVFSRDCLTLYSKFHIRPDFISMDTDTLVDGIMQARDYLSVSDRQLKKEIKKSDPSKDLERLMQLEIKDFTFKDDNRKTPKKGVIAQEVQVHLPCIISEQMGYIPNIQRGGFIHKKGNCIRILGDWTMLLTKNTRFKYFNKVGEQAINTVARATYHTKKRSTTVFLIEKTLIKAEFVNVYGTEGKYKSLDKDYLFMMAINAIKALNDKVDKLQN